MIAAYHLANGARPSNLKEFIDPKLIPDECAFAAVVGDSLDPVNGTAIAGETPRSIWGVIGAQLGPEAYLVLKKSEEELTAPGSDTWREAVGDKPTVIVIDELAAHLAQLTTGNKESQKMGKAMPFFLKSLLEAAASTTNLVVVITFASTQNAFGEQTQKLQESIEGIGAELAKELDETSDVASRFGATVEPAKDEEIGEILKRRLFREIDDGAAKKAGQSYETLMQAVKEENLSAGADNPVDYGKSVQRSYPFHPELIRVLDKRLGTLPKFQRARGSLRLLAEAIAEIYDSPPDDPMAQTEIINLADIDLANDEIKSRLTSQLDKAPFAQVVDADIAGPNSHAAQVDEDRFAGKRPYATRVGRTVFIHSLEGAAQPGAGRGDWLLGTLATGDEPAVIESALDELGSVAWYLAGTDAGDRARFTTEEQPNKIIASEARNVPNTKVREETEDRIKKAFKSDAAVKVIHFPDTLAKVPDEEELRLVVFHPEDLSITTDQASPPPEKVREYAEKAGASAGVRSYRNSVTFLVADSDLTDEMATTIKNTIAVGQIVNDAGRMKALQPEVAQQLRKIDEQAQLSARIAVTRCFKHLLYPERDKANGYLRHLEVGPGSQGEQKDSHTAVIVDELRGQGKIQTSAIPTDLIKSKAWPKDTGKVPITEVFGWFWRDFSAPILLNVSFLKEAIAKGITNKEWILYEPESERSFTSDDPPPSIDLSGQQVLFTPAEAESEGIGGRPPRLEDITSLLQKTPAIAGDDLRVKLEEKTGRVPTKSQVTDLLARGSEGGESAKLAVLIGDPAAEPEPGTKAATPSDIRKGSLSKMRILSMTEADRLSLGLPGARAVKDAEAQGSAAVAFASVIDQIEDSSSDSVTRLTVKTKADPGEGTRDVKLLGMAISRLPKHEIGVDLSVELDFEGLSPLNEIRLQGPASNYQKVEEALISFGNKAKHFEGTFSLTFEFQDGASPEDDAFRSVRKAVEELDPGEVTILAVLK